MPSRAFNAANRTKMDSIPDNETRDHDGFFYALLEAARLSGLSCGVLGHCCGSRPDWPRASYS